VRDAEEEARWASDAAHETELRGAFTCMEAAPSLVVRCECGGLLGSVHRFEEQWVWVGSVRDTQIIGVAPIRAPCPRKERRHFADLDPARLRRHAADSTKSTTRAKHTARVGDTT
jgi:hypothetical protein